MEVSSWIVPALILVVGALLLALILRPRGRSGVGGGEMAGRLAQLADAQARLADSVDRRMQAQERTLAEVLQRSGDRTSATLSEVRERLAVIDRAQRTITELSTQVVSLQEVLGNKQARGAFGEVQLHDLVSSLLPPSAYAFQATLSNGRRADCLIHLPNPPGSIVVDAKFPLESWYALRAAHEDGDDTARTQAARAFSAAVMKHVKDIADRYQVPGETADSALMFLPSEAIYAELHARFPQVVEQSWRARVWIVSPTTLMATLNTVRAGSERQPYARTGYADPGGGARVDRRRDTTGRSRGQTGSSLRPGNGGYPPDPYLHRQGPAPRGPRSATGAGRGSGRRQ